LAKKALLAGFPVENPQTNPTIEIGLRYKVLLTGGASMKGAAESSGFFFLLFMA
jgi:hypothetical protein